MAKKKAEEAAGEEAPRSLAEIWDGYAPESRISTGTYSIYKTGDGGMHIAYHAAGSDEDGHMPIPAMMLQMMIAASEGKGPLGRLKSVAMARFS